MFKNLKQAAMAALLTFASTAFSQPASPLKIGFVYVSPVGDAGWTYQHDLARLQMQQRLGARVQITVVENVPEGPESERVMRDLASQGHRLIFATSFGYLEPTLKVAQDHPQVAFEHAGGFKTAANVNTYNARYYEGRYLAGLVAGKMSKTGIAGYVAGFPIPEVIQGINAFARGLREANPTAEVRVVWLNTWFDPSAEREATLSLIGQGADVLTHHSASAAVPQTAEQQGKWVISYHSDMTRYAPTMQLTAVTHQWGSYYTQVAESMLQGRWQAQPVWGGTKEGFVRLAPFNSAVPLSVQALVQQRQSALASGRFHPFAGRIADNQGTVRQTSGTMSDAELATMNYYVEGVRGKLPGP